MNNSYSLPNGHSHFREGNLTTRKMLTHETIHKRLDYFMTSKKLGVLLSVGTLRMENTHKIRKGQLVGPSQCAQIAEGFQ